MEYPDLKCSDTVIIAIEALANQWDVVHENKDNPFRNTGGANRWNFGAFVVRGYDWSDEGTPYNFRWRDVKVSWYKSAGRSMRISREMGEQEIQEMLRESTQALSAPPLPVADVVW